MGAIRILLAIIVLLNHSGFLLNVFDAGLAVETFFIVSGFYMALILNEKYIGKNNSYKLFISNRFLKLYPIYWVVLVLSLMFELSYLAIKGGGGLLWRAGCLFHKVF